MLCDSAGGINILLFINYPLKTNTLIEKEVGVSEGELNEGGQKVQTSAYKINKS